MVAIAYLGPPGTYSEATAIAYRETLEQQGYTTDLHPYPSIAKTLQALARGEVELAIAPVENSIEGSVPMTLDTLWQLDDLHIQQAYVLPISHGLLSHMKDLAAIKTVYSHPQALAQCQEWLEHHLSGVELIPTNSTAEAIQYLDRDRPIAAISSQRAASLYQIPVLAYPINDCPDNCTRFWAIARAGSSIRLNPLQSNNTHTSIAFSLPNIPGVLVKPLEIFARQGINLSRIESRPTKRSLGEYLFFVDIEADARQPDIQNTLAEIKKYTDVIKVLGTYRVVCQLH
nr:prephenate dehydratase [Roseofilum casamattae]